MTNPMPHLHFTILNLRSTSTRSHSSPAVLSLFSGLSLFGAFQRRIRKPGSVLLAIVEILMVSVNLGRLSFRLKLLLACADTTFVRSLRFSEAGLSPDYITCAELAHPITKKRPPKGNFFRQSGTSRRRKNCTCGLCFYNSYNGVSASSCVTARHFPKLSASPSHRK